MESVVSGSLINPKRLVTSRGRRASGLAALAMLLSAPAVACGEDHTGHEPGHAESALTAQQCSYFAVAGKVQVCHRTSSTRNPYVIVRTSVESCEGHALHAGDYITSTDPSSPLYDPSCSGLGCLPAGAPADASIECCEGTTAINGVCQVVDPCAPTLVDDGNACTVDRCDPVTGISRTPVAVDDNNACTVDACDPVKGVSNTPVSVDDNNACTTDACDPVKGVSNTPVSIDDNNACTTDACDPVKGVSHTPVSADDNNACTTDSCDPATGVSNVTVADGTDCDDGDASTSGEFCTAGVCAVSAWVPRDCAGLVVDTTGLVTFRLEGTNGAGDLIEVWFAFSPEPMIDRVEYNEPEQGLVGAVAYYYFPTSAYTVLARAKVDLASGGSRCFDALPTDDNFGQAANIEIDDFAAPMGDLYGIYELRMAEAGGTGIVAGLVLRLYDSTGLVFGNTDLPLVPPALSAFDSRFLDLTTIFVNGESVPSAPFGDVFSGWPVSFFAP